MRFSKPAVLTLVLLAAGCSQDGTGSSNSSWFRASMSGAVSRSYEGTGDFALYREESDDTRRFFKIHSEGADAEVAERFYLRWPNDRRPGVGTYSLVPHADRQGSPHGVTGVYSWSRGDNVTTPASSELYVATTGVIQITRSTADEIEGTISFSGIQVTKWGPIYPERDDPRYAPDPTAPTIEVGGSFRLTRFDPDNVVVRTN